MRPPADHVAAAEALDRDVLQDYVLEQRRRWPAGGAALRVEAAGLAAVDGAGRDTRLLTFGPAGPALDALLDWHAAARAGTVEPARHPRARVVLPPDPPPALLRALAARGLAYSGHALVLTRPLAGSDAAPPDPELDVAPAGRAEATQIIARGYADGADPDPLDLRAAETWFDLPGATHLLAWSDGRPLGGGAVVVRGAAALLGQMSVLPEHRGRGVQRTLLAHRLRHARACGATLAVATCAPMGPSLRNLRAAGFRISHARVSLTD